MLRKFLLAGLLLCFQFFASSQKFNLSVYAGAGGTHFAGSGAAFHTTIPKGPPYYNTVDNTYGGRGPTNWFGGINAQWRLKNNWIFAASTQYEYLGSEVSFGNVALFPTSQDTMGTYKKKYHFISVNPEIGKVLWDRKTMLQVNAGIDYAFYVYGEHDAIFWKPTLASHGYSSTPGNNDIRFTAGAWFTWRKWKAGFTYKYGLTDYRKDNKGEVYSRLLQWKLMYSVSRRSVKKSRSRK
jgi:hypothetical protein